MQLTYNNNKLKIDNGDHYYIGIVNKDDFPGIISNDYEDIIMKSFNNFSDDTTTVKHEIVDNMFIIDFKFNCKPLKIYEVIKIKINKHDKDFKDYIIERIEKLENDNNELKIKLSELSIKITKKNKEPIDMIVSVNTDSEVEEKEQIKKPAPKGNRKAYA